MYEWIIVGGGVHGVLHANALLRVHGVRAEDIRIVDPHTRPLHRWSHRLANAGAAYLRSPGAHTLEPDFGAIVRFARTRGDVPSPFIDPYRRPSTRLFSAYVEAVLDRMPLADMFVRGVVEDIRLDRETVVAETSAGTLSSRRLLLAVGKSEELEIPPWAESLAGRGGEVHHVYDPEFDLGQFNASGPCVVVGGGIGAAQVALAMARRGLEAIVLSRRPVTVSMFDSEPCFIGPKCLREFRNTASYEERRDMIQEARRPGTVPQFVYDDLMSAVDAGRIRLCVGEVTDTAIQPGGTPRQVGLFTGAEAIRCTSVILATGFRDLVPAAALVDRLSDRYGFPRAPDGYPLPSPSLEWGGGIYLTGPLAELELGPPAPNIIGAHNAARGMLGVRSWKSALDHVQEA